MADSTSPKAFTDRPGWSDDLQRILVILILGVFVLGMGFALLWGMMNEREIPAEITSLGPVALGFLGAIVKEGS